MHVDVHGDEANGDCHDVTKDTPCDPTVSNKEDVALVKHWQGQEQTVYSKLEAYDRHALCIPICVQFAGVTLSPCDSFSCGGEQAQEQNV